VIRSQPIVSSFALFAALLVACESERPEPRASFKRPAGLAYVDRGKTGFTSRADLFVADSEAEGIRVVQLRRSTDDNDRNEILETDFLAAPSLFFPLVIPTRGFPTKVALAETNDRLYVIAPLSRILYAVDASQQDFHVSPENDGAKTLLEVPLDMEIGEDAVPVGVAVYPGFDGDDVVLVAFDLLERNAGVLAVFRFTGGNAALSLVPGSTEMVDIGAAPRDLLVRGDFALVTSALSNTVTIADLAKEGTVLANVRPIDAGGPTVNLIDANRFGIYATRLDRSSVVLFESTGGTLDRSTRRLTTAFTPIEDRTSSVALGRVDIRDSQIVTGAYGELKIFDTDSSDLITNDLLEGWVVRTSTGIEPAPMLALAHLDGYLSFLIGDQARLATNVDAFVSVIAQLEGDLTVAECEAPTSCSLDQPDPQCEPSVLLLETIESQQFRVTYQGAMASASSPAVVRTSTLADRLDLRLNDSTLASFERRRVRAGDSVLLAFEAPVACGAVDGPYVDLFAVATVTAMGAGNANELDLQIVDEDVVAVATCVDDWNVFRYEVYPNADEVVVALVGGGVDPIVVLERIPVDRSGAVAAVRTSTLVAMTIESASGFSCSISEAAGAPCFRAADCADGSACVPTGVCQTRCMSAECAPDSADCSTTLPVRTCSALEIKVNGTSNYTLGFGLGAPEDMVFSEQRRAFMISFPGGREIAEVFTDEAGEVGVRHIR
jgi:hypothetical protein